MISPRTVDIYGWISLGILVVLLVLVWTNQISQDMRLPVLIVAGVLIVSRLILRLLSRPSANRKGDDDSLEGGR